jgi:hypothetical protein
VTAPTERASPGPAGQSQATASRQRARNDEISHGQPEFAAIRVSGHHAPTCEGMGNAGGNAAVLKLQAIGFLYDNARAQMHDDPFAHATMIPGGEH